MEDSSTTSICNINDGYKICSDAFEASSYGLTNTSCNSLPNDEIYFTQETSAGGAQCYTDYPSTGNKNDGPRNDVWGCGGISICHPNNCYSTLTTMCNNWVNLEGFSMGSDNEYEYDNVEITNRSRGGVLCCPSGTKIPTTIPTGMTHQYKNCKIIVLFFFTILFQIYLLIFLTPKKIR